MGDDDLLPSLSDSAASLFASWVKEKGRRPDKTDEKGVLLFAFRGAQAGLLVEARDLFFY